MERMDRNPLCLDTGLLIAFLKDREPGAGTVRQAVHRYTCHVTSITVYELLFVVARVGTDIDEDALLRVMTVVPLGEHAARRAAMLHADLIHANADIGIKDTFIAAICLEHDLPLLTLNARHFSRFPALRVLTPDQLEP